MTYTLSNYRNVQQKCRDEIDKAPNKPKKGDSSGVKKICNGLVGDKGDTLSSNDFKEISMYYLKGGKRKASSISRKQHNDNLYQIKGGKRKALSKKSSKKILKSGKRRKVHSKKSSK